VATLRVTEAGGEAVANFGNEMLLVDANIEIPVSPATSVAMLLPGQVVPATLDWEALRPMDHDYTVSVQLVGPDGRLYGQKDAWPVQGTYPTSRWSAGQRITDRYQVTLAPDAQPGRYRLGVVVYLLATQTRVPLIEESGQIIGDIVWIGELEVVHR
jgi:hypothetical protein